MGRRTLSNPQFKDRRGVDLRAQVFALRRALAVKAQLVKNQQRQIDLLGRELANACMRIAALERSNTRGEETWERISDLAMARSRATLDDQGGSRRVNNWHQRMNVDLEQVAFDHLTDGVHDPQLHPSEAQARFDAAFQFLRGVGSLIARALLAPLRWLRIPGVPP